MLTEGQDSAESPLTSEGTMGFQEEVAFAQGPEGEDFRGKTRHLEWWSWCEEGPGSGHVQRAGLFALTGWGLVRSQERRDVRVPDNGQSSACALDPATLSPSSLQRMRAMTLVSSGNAAPSYGHDSHSDPLLWFPLR